MSNSDEPPRNTNQPPSSQSLLSLPLDIVMNILACVPKRCYPILCCVSKNLRSLVRSPEIYKTRSLLGKDSLYLCFMENTKQPKTCQWFTLGRIDNNNVFVSIDLPSRPEHSYYFASIIAIGTEIFFIPGCNYPSSSFWIFDTQSGKFRQGPSLLVNRLYTSVGVVGGKIYVIGGYRGDEIPAEVFDLKTQTWEAAPIPEKKGRHICISSVTVSFDRKVCALSYDQDVISYDTRDGSCERFELPHDEWWKTGVCVIDNVLYVYFSRFGLLWYDSQLMLWRVVYGLGKAQCAGMAEYYGKLAFLWEKPSLACSESKEIWCTMIGLDKSEAGIHGTAEASQLLGIVPCGYKMWHCLSLG